VDIWSQDKLFLFLVFFIPGFISIKIYDLLVPGVRRDFGNSLAEAIGYTAVNFALLSWLIIPIHSNNFSVIHPVWYLVLLFVILFVAPSLWPILWLWIRERRLITKFVNHPILKPWDWVFRQRHARWVIVHLTDGRRVGGKFGLQSFASSYPSEEQIYLEEVWELDHSGNFQRPIERSKGMIILNAQISAVEFFE